MKQTRGRLAGLIARLKSEHIVTVGVAALVVACVPQVYSAPLEARAGQLTRPARSASQAEPAPAPRARPARRLRQPLRTGPIQRAAVPPSKVPAMGATGAYPYPAQSQARPIVAPQLVAAQRILDARIREIGQSFNGDVGIAVRDIQTGWTSHFDGASHFPQQSVSKFWVSLTALDKADRGELSLTAPVKVRKSDLTLFNQPIAAMVKGDGYSTTLGDLIHRAITQSDNTANDFVLWRTGGPEAVRTFLLNKGISGVRFGPGERVMQARIAGMEWRPSMVGSGFYAARSALPMNVRRSALESYLDDPVDGATPIGVVDALTRLQRGELLSPEMTRRILNIMSNTRTGRQRLKGGLAAGWKLAHKTGTGQVLGSTSTGYNDIGIVTSPEGRSYAVAAMIRRTSAPVPQRMAMMQSVVRAVIDYDRNARGYNVATRAPVYERAPLGSWEDEAGEE